MKFYLVLTVNVKNYLTTTSPKGLQIHICQLRTSMKGQKRIGKDREKKTRKGLKSGKRVSERAKAEDGRREKQTPPA